MTIYLDWQVISYLNDPSGLDIEKMVDFICLEQAIRIANPTSLLTPYSEAHLADILKGPAVEHNKWIEWLSERSKGNNVVEMPENKERLGIRKVTSVAEHFDYYRKNQFTVTDEPGPLSDLMDRVVENTKAVTRISIARSGGGIKRHSALEKQIEMILTPNRKIKGIDIARLTKTMRGELRNETGRKVRFPEIPEVKDVLQTASPKKFRTLLDNAVRDSELPYSNFKELDGSVPDISVEGALSKFGATVNRLSQTAMLYFGIGTENIKPSSGDSKFQGIVNDLGHLNFGLRCDKFISADRSLFEKALFIKKYLDLPVDVLSPVSFLEGLLRDFAYYYSEEAKNDGKEPLSEYVFNFRIGENDLELRQYRVGLKDLHQT